MIKVGCAIFFCMLIASYNANANAVSERSAVKFEVASIVEVTDLWHFLPPQYVHSNFAIIGFWQFSEHEVRRDGDWSLIGVVVGGVEDTADVPVGATVWVKEGVKLLIEESQAASADTGDATAIFGFPEYLCGQELVECQGDRVTFVVKQDGTVIADGQEIGIVDY